MYRTKEHVDKHVNNILGQIRDEKERNIRGFQFARLYYEIKEYDTAKRYLSGFLTVRERYAPAYKLLGQIYEGLGRKTYPNALDAYKKSVEIDDKQKDILLKICNILCSLDGDPERAKFWLELAEKDHPHNDIVLRLRDLVCGKMDTHGDKQELEDLLAKELVKFPQNTKLRIKLLKLYVGTGRINEAYTHGMEVEKRLPHTEEIEWYKCLNDVFNAYQRDSGASANGDFHVQYLGILNQLLILGLERSTISECIDILHRFDQILFSAEKQGLAGDEWKVFYNEMQAQLFYHAGTLILKKAQQDRISWSDATSLAGACLLASSSFAPPNMQASWYVKASSEEKRTYDWWNKIACHRACQIGHVLKSWSAPSPNAWIRKIQEEFCCDQGKERNFLALFTQRGMKETKGTSYIMQNAVFTTFRPEIPSTPSLKEYTDVAHMKKPDDLHFLVWLSLQEYTDLELPHPDSEWMVFKDLQYGALNLESATPETLTQLDAEAFLMATVVTAAILKASQETGVAKVKGQIGELPASICDRLCTSQQQQWWTAAYQLYASTARGSLGTLRRTLQHGLEVIRLIGNHGVGIDVMVHLARTYAYRMQSMKTESLNGIEFMDEINALQARAQRYWKVAVPVLQRLIKNQPFRSNKATMFENRDSTIKPEDIKDWLKEGQLFLAKQDYEDGRIEAALKGFGNIESPTASFYEAQIYKEMAQSETTSPNIEAASETVRGKLSALLLRSREALYTTLDRLRGDSKHELNSSVAEELDEVESKISRLEVGQGDDGGTPSVTIPVGTPRKNVTFGESFIHSTPQRIDNLSLDVNIGSANNSAMQPRLRPSPDRLDAQLRSLAHSQDHIVKTLVEELRESRKTIQKLQEKVAELEAKEKVYIEQAAANKQQPQPPPPAAGLLPQALTHATPHLPGAPRPTLPRHPGYYAPSPVEFLSPQGYAAYAYTGIPGMAAPTALQAMQSYYQQPSSVGPTRQNHRQLAQTETAEEDYDEYFVEDEEENGDAQAQAAEKAAAEQDTFSIPDSQLIQEWPYGNAVNMEGKSTLTYAPQAGKPVTQGPDGYLPHWGTPSMYSPPAAIPGMPGPGYFSSPEQPRVPGLVQPNPGMGMVGQGVPMAAPNQQSLITVAPNINLPVPQPGQVIANTVPVPPVQNIPVPLSPSHPNIVATNFPMTMPSTPDAGQPAAGLVVTAPTTPATVTTPQISGKHDVSHTGHDQVSEGGFVCGEDGPGGHGPEFEPIVQLPEKVDLKTGEEDHAVLFSHRAKLFRFVEKQWKERGLGTIKILHKETTSQVRLVMRREQVHKVCANHYIKPDMVIDYKEKDGQTKDDKVVTWKAVDHSDDEARLEQFACKFKTSDVAAEFKEKFEQAIKITEKCTVEDTADGIAAPENAKAPSTAGAAEKVSSSNTVMPASTPGFGGFQFGTSTTPAADLLKSMATTAGKDSEPSNSQSFGGFSFTSKPVIKPAETETPQPAAAEAKTPPKNNPFTSFSFGSAGQAAAPNADGTPTTKPSTFGSFASPASSFASIAASGDSKSVIGATPTDAKGFSNKPLFGTPAGASPAKGDDEHAVDEYEPDVHFAPLVTLPEMTDLKTGEEEEKKMFGERAKLFRHDPDTKSWKERGIGEIKILANIKSGKFRILMRRDQVLKVCANHYISKQMKLEPMQGTNVAFCYLANDFSEEEHKTEFLAVKFKNVDIATNFKDVFEDCQSQITDVKPTEEEETSSEAQPAPGKVEKDQEVPSSTEKDASLSSMFQAKGRQWDCEGCYVRNPGDIDVCPACSTPKGGNQPSSEPNKAAASQPEVPTSTEKDASLSSMFQATGGQWDCEGCYVRNPGDIDVCPACSTPKGGNKPSSEPNKAAASQPPKTLSSSTSSGNSLAAMFQVKGGEWDCEACYVRNKGDAKVCLACMSPRPGCEEEQESEVSSSTSTFKIEAGGGFTFGGSAVTSGGASFGSSKPDSSKPAQVAPVTGGFSFGSTPSAPVSDKPAAQPASGFNFGSSSQQPASTTLPQTSGGFKFGAPGGTTMGGFTFGGTPAASSEPQKPADETVTSTQPDSTTVPAGEKDTAPKFGSSTFNFSLTNTTTPQKPGEAGPKSPPTPQSPEGDYYVNKEGEDDHIYFEPVVKLPDNVEIKTGEEDEEALYSHRAKLFRFDNKEWKERGLGEIKILQNKVSKKIRLLMRREKVLKICLNHFITSDMTLEVLPSCPGKAWTWHAMDAADDEPSHQSFAMRFKSEDVANGFKAAFEAVRDGKPVPPLATSANDSLTGETTPKKTGMFASKADTPDGAANSSGFQFGGTPSSGSAFKFGSSPFGGGVRTSAFGSGQKFSFGQQSAAASSSEESDQLKSPGGSSILAKLLTSDKHTALDLSVDDEVQIVEVMMPSADKVALARKYQLPDSFYNYELHTCSGCIGCGDAFDFAAIGQYTSTSGTDVQLLGELKASPDKIQRARQYGLPDNFYLYEKKEPCKGCRGCDNNKPCQNIDPNNALDLSKPKKDESGTTSNNNEPDSTTPDAGSLVLFGKPGGSGDIDFAALASKTSGFGFGQKADADKPFSWQGAGASVFGGGGGVRGQGGDDDEVAPSDDIHFEPIVQLPEVVDLKTGEEDDTEVFRHRAKLYRFDSDTKAWKERGIGEMKILKNKQTGRYRLLMRREQVLKVACNHALTPDIKLEPLHTSETSWCWTAQDYTEPNDPTFEQFALKFKNADIAGQFRDKFEECQEDMKADAGKSPIKQESSEAVSSVQSPVVRASTSLVTDTVHEEEEEEEEEYEDDEDETPVFAKRATLFCQNPDESFTSQGMGELRILMDIDVVGFRVVMDSDQGDTLCNHIICRTYVLDKNPKKRYVQWSAVDFSTDDPVRRTFRLQFSSSQVVDEFESHFGDGIQLAIESEIDPMVEESSAATREISFEEAAFAGQRTGNDLLN